MKNFKKFFIIKVYKKYTTKNNRLHIIEESEVMDFQNEQEKFDVIKWYDSIVAGEDRCGSYEFCSVCNKAEPQPCARAAFRNQARNLTKLAVVRLRSKIKG